jgi:hypothetical protein
MEVQAFAADRSGANLLRGANTTCDSATSSVCAGLTDGSLATGWYTSDNLAKAHFANVSVAGSAPPAVVGLFPRAGNPGRAANITVTLWWLPGMVALWSNTSAAPACAAPAAPVWLNVSLAAPAPSFTPTPSPSPAGPPLLGACVVTTVAGVAGAAGMADGAGTAARLGTPGGLAVLSDGRVAFTDPTYNSIRLY